MDIGHTVRSRPYGEYMTHHDAGLTPNKVLIGLWQRAGLSQQELAAALNRLS